MKAEASCTEDGALHRGWSPNDGQMHPANSLVRMEPEWKTDTSCTVDGAQMMSRSIHGIDYRRLFHIDVCNVILGIRFSKQKPDLMNSNQGLHIITYSKVKFNQVIVPN